MSRKNSRGREEWCLGGDFNDVLNGGERKGEGGVLYRRGLEDFNAFVEDMGLVDAP